MLSCNAMMLTGLLLAAGAADAESGQAGSSRTGGAAIAARPANAPADARRPEVTPSSGDALRGELRISPATVKVGLFYSGTRVHVEAVVPEGHEVALVCQGKAGELELKQKGKVFGVLWMNTGEVRLEHVPSVYLVGASCDLDHMPKEARDRFGIGYGALEPHVVGSLAREEAHPVFTELLKLKQSERLYAVSNATVRLHPNGAGLVRAKADFFLAAKAPPGSYEIRLYGVRDGDGILLGSGRLDVRLAGAAAFVSNLARNHGLLYGVLAVIVALVTGLLTGLVFGLGSKGGH